MADRFNRRRNQFALAAVASFAVMSVSGFFSLGASINGALGMSTADFALFVSTCSLLVSLIGTASAMILG